MDLTGPDGSTGDKVDRRWRALAFLGAIYALNYADRQILSVLVEPIKAEMNLTDAQISLLTGTLFALFYSTLSLPIAYAADRYSRVRIVAIACLFWSFFTGFTGFAVNLVQLAIGRIGVAAGEAGGAAPSLSLIGDFFNRRERVRAISLFNASAPIGMLIGILGGGTIAAAFGWRGALVALGAIGFIVVPLLLLFVREPEREKISTQSEPVAAEPFLTTVGMFIRHPSMRWLLLATIFCSCAGNSALSWTPAMLIRQFDADLRGMAILYGPTVALAMFLSAVMTGILLPRLIILSPRAYALFPAVAMLLCGPAFTIALTFSDWRTVVLALFFPFALINVMLTPAFSLIQELTPARSRATALALLMLALNLVGLGVGPLVVGLVSDMLYASRGHESLYWTLLYLVPSEALLCAICLFLCSRHLRADIGKARSAAAAA